MFSYFFKFHYEYFKCHDICANKNIILIGMIYYYNARFLLSVGRIEGGIVLPGSECLPSTSANSLNLEDLTNILFRWLHISGHTILCL